MTIEYKKGVWHIGDSIQIYDSTLDVVFVLLALLSSIKEVTAINFKYEIDAGDILEITLDFPTPQGEGSPVRQYIRLHLNNKEKQLLRYRYLIPPHHTMAGAYGYTTDTALFGKAAKKFAAIIRKAVANNVVRGRI